MIQVRSHECNQSLQPKHSDDHLRTRSTLELVQPHTKYIVIGFLDYTEHTGTVRIITLVCNKCITLTSTLRELPNKLKVLK